MGVKLGKPKLGEPARRLTATEAKFTGLPRSFFIERTALGIRLFQKTIYKRNENISQAQIHRAKSRLIEYWDNPLTWRDPA